VRTRVAQSTLVFITPVRAPLHPHD
jgi:hypothetical protein